MSVPVFCVECLYENQKKKSCDEDYLKEIRRILDNRTDDDTAPELAGKFDKIYEKYYGVRFSLEDEKRKYNDLVMKIESAVRDKIEASADPLATALVYARVGNYIDFATVEGVNEEKFLTLFDNVKYSDEDARTMASFTKQLEKADKFLLLADNCGEIVLDKLFIEQLHRAYPKLEIKVMVRGGTVQNDVTMEDALYVGIDKMAQIVSNGNGYAGTIVRCMSEEAKSALEEADVILSKGQGNYESLHEHRIHIFYSFLCKCDYFTRKFGVEKFTGMFIEEPSCESHFRPGSES